MENELADPNENLDEVTFNNRKLKSSRTERVKTKRSLSDLKIERGTANAVAVVLFWSWYGLDDQAIAQMVNVSIDAIRQIKNTSNYTNLRTDVLNNILSFEIDADKKRILDARTKAVNTLIEMLDAGNLMIKKAAVDKILAMNQFDKVEDTRSESELVIEVVHTTDTPVNVLEDRNGT